MKWDPGGWRDSSVGKLLAKQLDPNTHIRACNPLLNSRDKGTPGLLATNLAKAGNKEQSRETLNTDL